MLSLNQLGTVLSDPELRAMLKSVVTRKLNSDLKTVQAHAELSRHLTQNRRRQPNGESAELREIIKQHLEYYGTLVDLSLNFHQQLIDKLSQSTRSDRDPPVNGLTLAMTAPIGSTVRAPFKISNNRPEPISVKCRTSPFISEDGSQLIASSIAFNPPGAEIAPGAEEVFEAILPVSPDFVAGRLYLATLSADGFDAMSIVIRLRVEAQVPAPVPAEADNPLQGTSADEAALEPAARPVARQKSAPTARRSTAAAKKPSPKNPSKRSATGKSSRSRSVGTGGKT